MDLLRREVYRKGRKIDLQRRSITAQSTPGQGSAYTVRLPNNESPRTSSDILTLVDFVENDV